jgi:hypothetical protein
MLRRKPYWQAKKLRIKEDKDSLNSLRPTIWGASWNVPSADRTRYARKTLWLL